MEPLATESRDTLAESDHQVALPYEYTALNADQKEIRIILVLSREFSRDSGRGDDLICALENVQLDSVSDTYAALSYTWGEPGIRKEITILEEDRVSTISVQENLYDALYTFRLESVNRRIWADAICINQGDDTEKSSQVQLMGDVYRKAEATFIWLGSATPESDLAFDFMEKFADEYYDFEWEALLDLVTSEDDATATFPCDAMVEVLSRRWFSRIWVVQEVALASRAFLYCGEKCVEDAAFLLCTQLFYLLKDALARKDEKTEYETRLVKAVDCIPGRPMPIIHQLPCNSSREALPFLRWFEDCQMSDMGRELALNATDPRDLIFGLLGIASDAEVAGIKADYAKPTAEAYIDATKALLLQGNLDILGFAQRPRVSLDLPSWVPDWRTVPFRQPLIYSGMDPGKTSSALTFKGTPWEHEDYRSFSISPNTSVSIAFTDSDIFGTLMSLDVFVLSSISDFATSDVDPEGIAYTNTLDWVVQLMSLINKCDCKIYSSEEAQKDAILRTLVTDRLVQATAGRSSCRVRPQHLKPMQDIITELMKSEPDEEIVMEAHLRNTAPGTDLYNNAIRNIGKKTPFMTHGGWIGLGPNTLEKGDEIVIPLGGRLPLALRSDGAGKYRFVEEVYVHGIMDGEILKLGLPVVKLEIY